jgi:Ran GTPase-activating protein (RanGAP) involved in mRNA processing and transport
MEGDWLQSGFRRGLPARVKTALSPFLAHGDQLARIPVEVLHIDDRFSRSRRRQANAGQCLANSLAGCPALARFPGLDLMYNDIEPDSLATLLSSPHLPLLRELHLGPEQFGQAGAACLAECERLSELRCLDLSACRINPSGLQALLHSPHLGALRDVDLHGNNLDDECVAVLARHELMAAWRTLNIGYNDLSQQGVRALLSSPHLDSLEALDLSSLMPAPGTWLGDPLIEELVRTGLPKPSLRRLGLHSSSLTAQGISLLAQDERLSGLRQLDLAINRRLGREGAQALAASSHLAGLEDLTLFASELDDAAAVALAASPYLRPIQLSLGDNKIGSEGARALAESAFLERVVEIDLSDNPLGKDGVKAIAGASWLTRLWQLDLSRTEMGDSGLTALAESPGLAGIRRLILVDNRIGEKGALALARSPHAEHIRRLDLSRNHLGRVGSQALRGRFGARLVSHGSKKTGT